MIVAAIFIGTGLLTRTRWRVHALAYAKVIAVLYLIVLWECVDSIPELIQIFPSLLALILRNGVFLDRDGEIGPS